MAEEDRLVVVPAAVKAIGGDLQGSAGQFTGSASSFDSAMSALVAATKGDGTTEIDRLAHEWMRAHGQITKALNQLGIRTEDAGDQYDRGRQGQADEVSSRGQQMDFKVESI